MRDRNYIWDPGTFRVLGINFSKTIENIVGINYQGKLEEIKKAISKWNKRQLTPIGKVTVIKTLLAPKLIYLLTNLPDPSSQPLKEICKCSQVTIFTQTYSRQTDCHQRRGS